MMMLRCIIALLLISWSVAQNEISMLSVPKTNSEADRPDVAGWKSFGWRWKASGDANNDAIAKVFYRKKGDTNWLQAENARRVNGETAGS
jgi:hypothetical protein